MNKTTTILTIMALIMLVPVMAASSENDEQTIAYGPQDNQSQSQQADKKDISPFIIIGIALMGLWHYKQRNGGKQK